jgi:hypothetical protein
MDVPALPLAIRWEHFMIDDLNFSADEFAQMTHRQKIRLCRLLAARAEQMAAHDIARRTTYEQIAEGWKALADEMEK